MPARIVLLNLTNGDLLNKLWDINLRDLLVTWGLCQDISFISLHCTQGRTCKDKGGNCFVVTKQNGGGSLSSFVHAHLCKFRHANEHPYKFLHVHA